MKKYCKVAARGIAWFMMGMILVLSRTTAMAYDEAPVVNGGSISGMVTVKGSVPPPRAFPLALYPFGPACAKNARITDGQGNALLDKFRVGPEGGFQDVVIAVEGVERGKPFEPITAQILVRGCEFLPYVSVIQKNAKMVIKNEDPFLHNSQVYQSEKGNILLNVPVPPNSEEDHSFHFEKSKRISQMICGMHEFMQTWGFAVDNPYYALTGLDGKFRIEDLPPGKYKVTAWRPNLDPIERTVTINPNETTSLNFVFDGSQIVRPHYESQRKFRIQH